MLLYLAVASSGLMLLIGQGSTLLLNRSPQERYAPQQPTPVASPPLAATPQPPLPPSPFSTSPEPSELSSTTWAIAVGMGDSGI